MTQTLSVLKTVSGGNDFLQIDGDVCGISPESFSLFVRSICSRHNGLGADGIVVRSKRPDGATKFRIYNRDGNEAELSGNGMAGCAASLMLENPNFREITLFTAVGPRTVTRLECKSGKYFLLVEIGPPDFNNRNHFPFLDGRDATYCYQDIPFTPVSVGNPHAVVIFPADTREDFCLQVARRLQKANIFPEGINIEVVRLIDSEKVKALFFERGVGRTQTSSTGSAAVFAVLKKLNPEINFIRIVTPGTTPLRILSKGASIAVENTTKIVYKGEYAWNEKTDCLSV